MKKTRVGVENAAYRRGRDSNPRYRQYPYDGLANRNTDDATADATSTYEHAENELHQEQHQDAELSSVFKAWPRLPEAIRAGIVAMVKAASKPA